MRLPARYRRFPIEWRIGGEYNRRVQRQWFKLMFPSGYITDVLQNLEALCELGYGRDSRLANAVSWLLSKQDGQGRWPYEYAYNGKTVVDFEK